MLSKRFKNDGKPSIKINELQKRMISQIEGKITSGVYAVECVSCCICGNENFEVLSEKDRYGLYHPVGICRDCGLVQVNPRMTQESYQQFYGNEYRKLYMGRDSLTDGVFKGEYQHGAYIYHYLTDKLLRQVSGCFIVEVGCGSGGILQYFKEKGNEVYGVDLGTDYLGYGRANHQLELEVGTLDNILQLGRNPDIVIYSHTLEHIVNPLCELNKLRSILREDSLLYIELPGNKWLRKTYRYDFLRLLQNAHVYYFTQTTLMNLLGVAGYSPICIDEAIVSVFRKSGVCTYEIANDYADGLAFLKGRETYRHVNYYTNLISIYARVGVREILARKVVRLLKRVGLFGFVKRIYDGGIAPP